MEEQGILGFILILINSLISYQGIKDRAYFDKYSFKVSELVDKKEYKRLITSGFLHVGWMHLAFNMVALYSFSSDIELTLGIGYFLLIYFGSLIGGNLLSLFIHRNHYDYSAVGASGAISGLIFTSIALFPDMTLGLIGIPYQIPSWIFGLLYVLFSIYGIKSQKGNIGHDAHLGGGIIGMLLAIAIVPSVLSINYLPILLILVPSIAFIVLIIVKPEFLLFDTIFQKNKGVYTFEDKYNLTRVSKEQEIDKLLDKISKKGIDSLSEKEKKKLNDLTK